MARAYGSSATLLLKREFAYGQAAAGDYIRIPFNRCTLGSEQGLIDDPVLGQGRDPYAPLQDAIMDEGEIVVPVDPRYIGLWLTGLLGTPTTTDDSADPATYTHEFVSGTIRASGSNTPRQQAGHKTVPDLAAMPSKSPCNVGAIHTKHSGSRFAPQIRCHEIARHRLTVYECLPYMHMSLGCVKGRPIAEKVEHRLTVIVSADVVAHRGATHSRRRI